MAIGKPLNKKSFYGGNESGSTPDIAMPNYNEPTPIQDTSNPWDQSSAQAQQPEEQLFKVPNELPTEVVEEMDSQEYEEQEQDPVAEAQPQEPEHLKKGRENFKSVRDAKEKAERERDEILRQMLEMQKRMESMYQQQQPQQQTQPEPQEDPDFDIDPEALVEGKHVRKFAQKMKAMEQKLQQYEKQSTQSAVEHKIKVQFPDFEKVVSRENVEILNEQYPEIAASLRDTPDIFNKAAAAYKVIKNFGIYKDKTPYDQDKVRAEQNAKKPRPLTSVSPQQGDSPLSHANAFANGMSDDLKEQLRREMFAARKAL